MPEGIKLPCIWCRARGAQEDSRFLLDLSRLGRFMCQDCGSYYWPRPGDGHEPVWDAVLQWLETFPVNNPQPITREYYAIEHDCGTNSSIHIHLDPEEASKHHSDLLRGPYDWLALGKVEATSLTQAIDKVREGSWSYEGDPG